MMCGSWNTFTHEHACARRCLEDVVDTFDLECRTLLVGTSADGLRDALSLGPRDEVL